MASLTVRHSQRWDPSAGERRIVDLGAILSVIKQDLEEPIKAKEHSL